MASAEISGSVQSLELIRELRIVLCYFWVVLHTKKSSKWQVSVAECCECSTLRIKLFSVMSRCFVEYSTRGRENFAKRFSAVNEQPSTLNVQAFEHERRCSMCRDEMKRETLAMTISALPLHESNNGSEQHEPDRKNLKPQTIFHLRQKSSRNRYNVTWVTSAPHLI